MYQCFISLKELIVKTRRHIELEVRKPHGGNQQKLPPPLESTKL